MNDIFPSEVAEWQRRGAKIIDVREPEEYGGGHLPGALNIPLGELLTAQNLSAQHPLAQHLGTSPLVVVCASGGRSARAALLLEEAGHPEVANLLGGTSGWMQENRPIEFPKANDRHP